MQRPNLRRIGHSLLAAFLAGAMNAYAQVNENDADKIMSNKIEQYLNDGVIDWYSENYNVDFDGKIFEVDCLYFQNGIFNIIEYASSSDSPDYINDLVENANSYGVPCFTIPIASSEDEIKSDIDAIFSGLQKPVATAIPGTESVTVACDVVEGAEAYAFYCAPVGENVRPSEKLVLASEVKDKPSAIFTLLDPNETYLATARIIADNQEGPYSDPIFVSPLSPEKKEGGGGGGGCFIATAAFGDYDNEFVNIYKDFRDNCLLTNPVGKFIVELYYEISPGIAKHIEENETLKEITKTALKSAAPVFKSITDYAKNR